MLTATGRQVRLVVTLLLVAITLTGTLVGQDDDFPFGPFRMYSTRDDPDGAATSTRVEAVDSTGRTVVVPDTATGLRRAEIEGQVGRFLQDPALLGELSAAHDALHPDQPRYQTVRIVVRHLQLADSRPTGTFRDEVVATWQRP